MNNAVLRRIAPPAMSSANREPHPAVVEACLTTFSDGQIPEIPWGGADRRRMAAGGIGYC